MPQNPFASWPGTPEQRGIVQEGTIPFAGITKDSQASYPPVPAAPAPAPAPAPSVPAGPQAPINFMPPQPTQGGPQFSQFLPLMVAALAGGKNVGAIGAGLASFMEGKRLRDRERLDARTLAQKEAFERAEFYSRAVSQAQQIDDPVLFEQFVSAIEPVARLHGIGREAFAFNQPAAMKRERREAAELLKTLDAKHPDGNYEAEWKGRRISRAELAKFAGVAAYDAQGQPLNPTKLPTPRQAPAVGSFEHYVVRKYGEHPTPEQITQARKEYGQADDATSTVTNAFRPYQTFQATETLAKKWTDASKPVKEMARHYRLMETGLKRFRQGDKNGGSQAVLVTFQKILDPTSVVRESEYARTTAGQSLLNRIEGYTTRLAQGGTTLTDAEMAEMVQTAKDFLDGAQASLAGARRRIESSAREFGVKPELVFDDVLIGGETEPAPTDDTAAPQTPVKIKSIRQIG